MSFGWLMLKPTKGLSGRMYIYSIFLAECFVTIATCFAQNPGLKALHGIPALSHFYMAYTSQNIML